MKMIHILSLMMFMSFENLSMTQETVPDKRFECQTNLSLKVIEELLARHPCLSIELADKQQQRIKRSQETKGLSFGGTHTNIEEKQTITYIINNSTDAHQLTQSIRDHSTTAPYFGSWRDCFLILSIVLHCFWIVWFLFRSQLNSCHYRLMGCCCSATSIARIQQIKQEKKMSKMKINSTSNMELKPTSMVQSPTKKTPNIATIQYDNNNFLDF